MSILSTKELHALSENHPIVFVDGQCVFCDNMAQSIHRKDKANILKFGTLQNYKDQLDHVEDSILVLYKGNKSTKISALRTILPYLAVSPTARFLIDKTPLFLSNIVYDLVAKYRYHIFGKKENCDLQLKESMI